MAAAESFKEAQVGEASGAAKKNKKKKKAKKAKGKGEDESVVVKVLAQEEENILERFSGEEVVLSKV